MERPIAKFVGMCPNCGGDIYDDRLSLGLPCRNCLPIIPPGYTPTIEGKKLIINLLRKEGKLKKYDDYINLFFKTDEVCKFFEEVTGKRLWSAQRTWAKRILLGYSFSISAPTGVGKTFFGYVISLYLAKKKKKRVYIILPTTPLVIQVTKNMLDIVEKNKKELGKLRIISYHHGLPKKERDETINLIKNKDFDILITTAQFLAKNYEILKNIKFDLVFVDDVDAVMKSSKNIDRLLVLIGFTEEIVTKTIELIDNKLRLSRLILSQNIKDESVINSIKNKIEELENEISRWKKKNKIGQIVIASATARPKGKRIRLFKELLGFQVGGVGEGIRKIYDVYILSDPSKFDELLLEHIKRLGTGGLVFVPKDLGVEKTEQIAELLRSHGIKAEAFHAEKKKGLIEAFANGEIDILVGVAFHHGLLVRGLDLPARVRYAIFYDIPRHIISLASERISPISLLAIMGIISDATGNAELDKRRKALSDKLRRLEPQTFKLLTRAILNEEKVEGYLKRLKEEILKNARYCISLLKQPDVFSKVEQYPYVRLLLDETGSFTIIYPDIDSYIQASGRTSRLYPGGVTTGLSIILTSDKYLINGLRRQLIWRYEHCDLVPIEEVNLDEIIHKIDEDRYKVRSIYEGKEKAEFVDPIKSAVLIVESPNKAKTISMFFGRPTIRRFEEGLVYEVTSGDYVLNIVATKGHMFDLTVEGKDLLCGVEKHDGYYIPVYDTIKRCKKCGTQFVLSEKKCPKCGSTDIIDARDVVRRLQELTKEVDVVFLASDPDVEGEKIAWDTKNVVFLFTNDIRRMEFHEVSKLAIDRGLKESRSIDMSLVKAQLVRRIEDRWIGFELSKMLWKRFNDVNLSAGRVQSAVLRWIIDRYLKWRETLHFYFRIFSEGFDIIIDFPDVKENRDAEILLEKLKNEKIIVEKVEKEEREIKPLPPYTTDSMLYDATTIMKISAAQTMKLAQDLFESGLITYHRTDSTRVSSQGIKVAKDYITDKFSENEFTPRSWGVGGAHECIRPVKPLDQSQLAELIREGVLNIRLTAQHLQLYGLIFRRFIASQMKAAKVIHQRARVKIADRSLDVEGIIKVIEGSEGFTKVYSLHLPKRIVELKEGAAYPVTNIRKWIGSPYELYTQAEIIREMKEKGIGRPSTYAIIVKKLFDRKYIQEVNGRIKPTPKGISVAKYLTDNFYKLVSDERTKVLYEKMDKVETNEADYQQILQETYNEIVNILYREKAEILKPETRAVEF
ncbi:MAG: reverse gyrase [Candidatus Asgardarchaeum sp.]